MSASSQDTSSSCKQNEVAAAIDIGSNTIHIVVARVHPDTLDILADEVELVRIGESVTATGEISDAKRDATLTTLRIYKALAEQHLASPILVVATEAIRQAKNSAAFVEDIRRETGLEVRIVTGDVEAMLTFAGATYEMLQEPHVPSLVGVIDLGGGSMELVTAMHDKGKSSKYSARRMHITWRTSLPLGSGWLHDRYLPSDPPESDELSTAWTFLSTYLKATDIEQYSPVLTVTGGSANSLLHLSHQAFRRDLHTMHMSREDIVRCEGLLHTLPAQEISDRYDQPVERVRILPAGALILRATMERLHVDEIQVSPHGIREGVLLAYAQYGEQWLPRITEQEMGKTTPHHASEKQDTRKQEQQRNDSFLEMGRCLLHERVEAFLQWRDDVLKGNDIEAVHRMRVASRRLRAVLDAYEPVIEARHFKDVYRQVKRMANLLGEVRDTDVMMQHLRQVAEQTPADEQASVRWLLKRLRTYRKKQQHKVKVFFKKLDVRAFEEKVTASLVPERKLHGES
jgi:exopolyphosphatase/pppGpp-phosphohydrolase